MGRRCLAFARLCGRHAQQQLAGVQARWNARRVMGSRRDVRDGWARRLHSGGSVSPWPTSVAVASKEAAFPAIPTPSALQHYQTAATQAIPQFAEEHTRLVIAPGRGLPLGS